ncbi:MAG TPA: hypothetical protein VMI56_02200 [Reyranella sp.]|nr:hypothetical protein [Reyranella sp.]
MSRLGKLVVLVGFLLSMASAARAQVPEELGFFGNIDGRWMWLGGDHIVTSQGATAPISTGPGGEFMVGYKFSPHWDAALAGDVQGLLQNLTQLRNGTLSVDNNHQHFDLEAGYSDDWWRLSAGLRGIHYFEGDWYVLPGFYGNDQRQIYGIGPKVGGGVRGALSENWAIVGGLNAAFLIASFSDSGNGVLGNTGYTQIVPQFDGELGLSWRTSEVPSFSFTTGVRAAVSFNTAISSDGNHQATLFEYGPFIRMAYNFAGPGHRRRSPGPEAEIWTNHPLTGCDRYVVHFDYERSDINLVASTVIRQAAEDVRRGRPANIGIAATDRADRSDYGHALSLARAEAIRQELRRNGIDGSQVIIGQSDETVPLKPLPGGTQEARNMRAQITF